MDLRDYPMRAWPVPRPGAAPPDEPVKVAESPPATLEALAGSLAQYATKVAAELTPGIYKVAQERDGEALPPVTRQNIWRHPNAHPGPMMLLLIDHYGEELFEWSVDTLLTSMKRDGLETSNANRTKILAARVAINSPSPWRQWTTWHWVCLGLAGVQPNMTYLEEPELGYMVAGWDFMRAVDPPRDTSLEVDKYVAASFRNEGIVYIPEPLDFAQREAEDRKIKCLNCDAIHRDDNDERCVTCGSPRLESLPFGHAAVRDATRALWNRTKNLPLEQALDVVEGMDEGPETAAVTQLLVHWDYADQVRAHLVTQLRMLGSV
jgi:hypothetical protein